MRTRKEDAVKRFWELYDEILQKKWREYDEAIPEARRKAMEQLLRELEVD